MDATRADSRPLHEQVADKIRQLMASGDLKPGDRLSPEDELATEYGVSRHTIRRALQDLTAEGRLVASRGRGRVVRAYRPLIWHLSSYESREQHARGENGAADQWDTNVRDQGREPHQDVRVEIVTPPPKVRELLGLNEDDTELVIVRRRVRYVDGTPYQLADSYFRESLVRGTPLMEPRDVSAPGGVLASMGRLQARYSDEIAVRMPSKTEADRLELPQGTPVAEVTRTGYDADGTALRVMVTVAPGDRHILYYEIDAS